MLARFRLRPVSRITVRCMSEKGDKIIKEAPANEEEKNVTEKRSATSTKITDLMKAMIEENKVRTSEQAKAKFTTAPGTYKKQKKQRKEELAAKEAGVDIEDNLTKAAGEVAELVGGDVKKTEAELLSKVLGKVAPTPTKLSDLIVGMKIERNENRDEEYGKQSRGDYVKGLVRQQGDRSRRPRQGQGQGEWRERGEGQRGGDRRDFRQRTSVTLQKPQMIDIFNAEPLNIFPKQADPTWGTSLDTWTQLQAREVRLSISRPPANYYEKMLMWTQQGKVWKFPIDNEQGLEAEQDIHFSEHVFLDSHLEGWCPARGPVREFMELVCVGLSKNPFYTAPEKREHILWFKEYFEAKKDLLTEVGAWNNVHLNEKVEA